MTNLIAAIYFACAIPYALSIMAEPWTGVDTFRYLPAWFVFHVLSCVAVMWSRERDESRPSPPRSLDAGHETA